MMARSTAIARYLIGQFSYCAARSLAELAQQTDRGVVLAEALIERLRQQRIILPALEVIERVCSEALTRGTRQMYQALTAPLTDHHRRALDGLLAIWEGT